MKKFLTLALVLVMALTLSVSVFAADIVGGESGSSTLGTPDDIEAVITVEKGEAAKVYRVDIAWENMNFTYAQEYDIDWDPARLEYTDTVEASWSHKQATITITNRSNDDVTVSAEATPGEANVNYTFDGTETLLTRADVAGATDTTYTFKITDEQGPTQTGTSTIATISITLE